ncbi:E3 ubiquitin- ligase RNF34 isoform X1 [Brachionus plicatilis]|uniref:E3 ubiquitin-ligase RNF34 isoform X1 n=1 Tax=Brachionus plicatilis TaxID=10195 RepID=A0A3M7PW48_BRAPC|nr:E3 ubiquitin- ligase RNF34 isoform X1 [Brachionus plicatilis]
MSTKNDEANTTDTCENCSTSFNLFKRKKICTVCNQAFCQYCVSRLPQSARSSSRICNTCKTICAPQSTIDDLLNIKVKHLRSVLSTSSIPTNTCKEKRDLCGAMSTSAQPNTTQPLKPQHIFVFCLIYFLAKF